MNCNSHPNQTNKPRVFIFSLRNLYGLVSRCNDYEFEDVVCTLDDVELFAPQPYSYFKLGQKISNRLARHTPIINLNPGIRKHCFTKNYDLFIMKCLFLSDLTSLNSLKGWKQFSRTSVCWIMESWAGELHKFKGHLKILSQFDHVIINCSSSIQPIQDAIQKPCYYIPPGVDAILFSPYPAPPDRCIDVYNLGRRSNVMHNTLLKMVKEKQIFYIYDTIDKLDTSNPSQHRELVANIAKRSRYFFANAGKIDLPSETKKQAELGPRFFEGAAAGVVMLGDYPENDAFKTNFNWPEAVIRIPYNTPNIDEILADLDSQPERLSAIRENNVINSLLRHDWAYRWEEILKLVNLEPCPALLERKKHLENLAEDIRSTS